MALVKIPTDELLELQELYKVDWPLHILTYNTFKIFINRHKKIPKWSEKIQFWSLNGDWRTNGTFVMVNDYLMFFNTLESEPHGEISKALMLIRYPKFSFFMDIRDMFWPLLRDVIKKLQLRVISNSASDCHLIPREIYLNFEVVPPDGFQVRPLTLDHAAMINKIWPDKNERSLEFVENLIKFNANFGLFNEKDELIAWNLSYDSGAIGLAQVVEHEKRNRHVRFVFAALAKTLATSFGTDIYFCIEQGNTAAEGYMKKKLGLEAYDVHRWIKVGNDNAVENSKSHL